MVRNNGIVVNNGRASEVALLLIDVVNHFNFPGGKQLLQNASAILPRLRNLKKRARKAGIPIIYVNDHFGRWRSSFPQVLGHCLKRGGKVRSFVEAIAPNSQDYIVLKPRHSAFYQTPLPLLLDYLGIKRLILTGLATNSCILVTASDAYMREIQIAVPADCCAARTEEEHAAALGHLSSMFGADVTPASSAKFRLTAKTRYKK